MHSLKNTVVAVGLLGLSFLFYQASSKPVGDDDGLMVPVLEVSEGLDGLKDFAASSTDAIKSKMNSAQSSFDSIKSQIQTPSAESFVSNIKVPELPIDLSQPKQAFTGLANDVTNKVNDFASNLTDNAQSSLQTGMSKAANSLADAKGKVQSEFNSLSSNFQKSTIPPAGTSSDSFQPVNATARDQGLINALGTQKLELNQPSSNDFSRNENQFISQPMSGDDSSFNQLASNDSSNSPSNVVQANVPAPTDYSSLTFDAAWPEVDRLVAEENFREALRLLSRFYRDQSLTGPQRQRLTGWLDALAGKVIFSAEHHLTSQPFVTNGESVTDLSRRWGVPEQLIYNVNSLTNGIAPGTQLKQIQGPFSAEINLKQRTMTMFLGDLYAGRYPVRVGISGTPRPGQFDVMVKSEKGHSWRDSQGQEFPIGSPQNGYGPYWMGLSGSLCIHAVSESANDGHHGCLGLKESDAKDVFAILGQGSRILIAQ